MQIRQRLITAAVLELLQTGTQFPFDVLRPPEDPDIGDTLELPYGIIIPRPRGPFTGAVYSTQPWSEAQIEYRIKSVGRRYDQAELMADTVREVMLGRDADGSYTFEMTIENHSVMERRPGQDSPGAPLAAGNIVEVDDSFIIAVTVS